MQLKDASSLTLSQSLHQKQVTLLLYLTMWYLLIGIVLWLWHWDQINKESLTLQPLWHHSPSHVKLHLMDFEICTVWALNLYCRADNLAKLNSS